MSKVAFITGGATGIGFACAVQLGQEGYKIFIISRSEDKLKKASKKFDKAVPEGFIAYKNCDVSRETELRKAFQACIEIYGRIDVLINAAAIIQTKEFDKFNSAEFDQLMAINVRGTVLASHFAYQEMLKQKSAGAIINISSLGGIAHTEKFPGFSSYVTSKFAITGFTESLAAESKKHNIRVNAVAPGAVATDMLKKAAPGLKTSVKPDDIAKTICYLCDYEKSGHINGSIMVINSNE